MASTVFSAAPTTAHLPPDHFLHVNAQPTAPSVASSSATTSASTASSASNQTQIQGGVRMIKNYRVLHTLGTGLQGKVKLGLHVETNERVALKIIDINKLNRKSMVNVYREIEAMARVAHHPNVLRLLGVYNDLTYWKQNGQSSKQVIVIVLELATGGELFDFMMYTGRFSESIARTYFQQLVRGLAHCHANGVYHRDIKPENLLLDEDFNLKMADFGLSGLREAEDGAIFELYTQCGTRSYMSPEVLSCLPYEGEPADVWSAGVVLFIMLAGFPPFQMATRQDWWFRACATKQYDAFWAAHSRGAAFSPGAKALLSRIFCVNPRERITLEEIQNDPWFQETSISPEDLRLELVERKRQVDEEKRLEREREREQRQKAKCQQGEDEVFDPFDMDVSRSIASSFVSEARSSFDTSIVSCATIPDTLPKVPEFVSDTKTLEELHQERLVSLAESSIASSTNSSAADQLCAPTDSTAPSYPKASVALYTTFQSKASACVLQQRIEAILSEMVSVRFTAKRASFKTKVQVDSVSFSARIFTHPFDSELRIVEFRRCKGCCFKFQEFYKRLTNKLTDVIWTGHEPEEEEELGSEELISDEARMI